MEAVQKQETSVCDSLTQPGTAAARSADTVLSEAAGSSLPFHGWLRILYLEE